MFQREPIAFRKRSSAPGRSGNSKRNSTSSRDAARVPADHVAHVQLGHLVVGHVDDGVARRAAAARTTVSFSARPCESATPTKICALAAAGVAVVELGDAALAEHLAEAQEAARLLGNRHGQQRLALPADLGALGDVAQAVEVHVGAAVDRRPGACPRQPSRATYFFSPATASAPAGSTIERVSSKMSWIAAQISSVLTAARSRRRARGTGRRSPRRRASPPRRRRRCRRARASRAARHAATRACRPHPPARRR